MKILIIENEEYLARSIASKLEEYNHDCIIKKTPKTEKKHHINYDAVLISTSFKKEDIVNIIEENKNLIIILLATYNANDTLVGFLKLGANDYIQKPFSIEELIRKLEHYSLFNHLKTQTLSYEEYIRQSLSHFVLNPLEKKTELPLLIRATNQKYCDTIVFKYIKDTNKKLIFIPFDDQNIIQKIKLTNEKTIAYINHLHLVKKNIKDEIMEKSKNSYIIMSSSNMDEFAPFNSITIHTDETYFEFSGLLSIEEYIKQTIICFQKNLTDTEIAQKLGISRKNLWEKRKKFNITKKTIKSKE